MCRFSFPHPAVPTGATVVWAAPGGGMEPGELPLEALRRELREDTGVVVEAELISGWRWWRFGAIAAYDGPDLFSPRDLATPLAALVAGDVPGTPLLLGL